MSYNYYVEEEGPPSRPSRRNDHHKDNFDNTFSAGHYAESSVVMPANSSQRHIASSTLPSSHRSYRRKPRSNFSNTLKHRSRSAIDGEFNHSYSLPRHRRGDMPSRSHSRASRINSNGQKHLSKITRTRSLSSRPFSIKYPKTNGFNGSVNSRLHDQAPSVRNPSSSSKFGTQPRKSKSQLSISSKKGRSGVVIDTMMAPNPFCPNTRGVCCLLLLLNMAIILICIGFIIVIQLYEPDYVWNIGIVILIFGFITLLFSFGYCLYICREKTYSRSNGGNHSPGELYWTHHWQKNFTIPEINSKKSERWDQQDHFPSHIVAKNKPGPVEGDFNSSSYDEYPSHLFVESDYETMRRHKSGKNNSARKFDADFSGGEIDYERDHQERHRY